MNPENNNPINGGLGLPENPGDTVAQPIASENQQVITAGGRQTPLITPTPAAVQGDTTNTTPNLINPNLNINLEDSNEANNNDIPSDPVGPNITAEKALQDSADEMAKMFGNKILIITIFIILLLVIVFLPTISKFFSSIFH